MQKYCFFSLNAIVYKKLTRYFGSMGPGRGCLAGWQRNVAACRMGLKGGQKRRRRGSGNAWQAMAARPIAPRDTPTATAAGRSGFNATRGAGALPQHPFL